MTDATTMFFEGLSRRRHEPMLGRISGAARIDVTNDGDIEHWYIQIDKGDLHVSRQAGSADCVIRGDRDHINDLVSGRTNGMTQFLRGSLAVDGNPEMLVLLQRLFGQPAVTGSSAAEEGSTR